MVVGVAGASWNSVCKDGAWPEDSACWDIRKCRVSIKHTHTPWELRLHVYLE